MTSMEEESWTSWLCDLDAEDYNFSMNESIINVVDEGSFPTHHDNDVEKTESQISYATFNTDNSSTMSNSSSGDDNNNNNNNITSFERPTKVLKTSTTTTTSSNTTGYLSQKDSSSPSSYILSFDNIVNAEPIMLLKSDPGKVVANEPLKLKGSLGKYQLKEPTKRNVQEGKKSGSVNRSPHQAQDHIIAERLRRERISHQFIALSALIPGLKKMDKATVLGDAIKHVKHLQEQVKVLEEEAKKRRAESVVYVEKSSSQVFSSEDVSDTSSNYGDCDTPKTSRSLPEVEARFSQKNVLIRIHCENKKGVVVNILNEIQKLHLSVTNSSALLFGTSIIDITIIAQMDDKFSLSLKELAKNLRVGLSQLM